MAQADDVWAGSRRLLRHVRDAMAAPGTGQQRLDKVVRIVASEMVAEVCSVYVRRSGDVLELFATEGLRREAIHRTRLNVGEGLVGNIAAQSRPLALADAQSHPDFAYRPETGEEIYHSFMGVPVLRGGRVIGVLVVQNRSFRDYDEGEIETLQTVAMVLAELIAGGGLISAEELAPAEGIATLPTRLEGRVLNDGLAMGVAVLHRPRVTITQMVAEDVNAELGRLQDAVAGMRSALDDMLDAADVRDGGEHREILESYRMFADDRGWVARIGEAVHTGLTAEAAVQKVQDDTRARMAQATDPYLRERLSDLDDLGNRLIVHLSGGHTRPVLPDPPVPIIVFARTMGPAELLDYDRKWLRGLILEEGSPTAHVTIVARALDIPVIGQVKDALARVEPLDAVIADGDNGQVFVRPSEDVRDVFAASMRGREARQASYLAMSNLPAVTRDGIGISLNLNAGLLVDLPHLKSAGADGVGLYRTEIPFMVRADFPGVAAQADLYRKIYAAADGKPVVFRTLDIGGDKVLPYMSSTGDENPAMGWRAIRIALDRPHLLRQQLRALIQAASGARLDIMFPMVAEVAEFDAARAILDIEIERAAARGGPLPSPLRVGAMLEVPALALQLPALLRRADFLSVGSNDLIQFLFASDRGNPRLANRYDVLSPVILSFLHDLALRCSAARVPLAICGDMGSRPLETMALIGVGMRSLSMPGPAIGPVKAMVRSLELRPLEVFLDSLYASSAHTIRDRLLAYARDHGVAI